MPALLEVQNLTMRFGNLTALDQVSLHVDEGEIVGLIGPNGSGKTTCFNCISRFYDPIGGRIRIEGRDIGERLDRCFRSLPRRGIKTRIGRPGGHGDLLWARARLGCSLQVDDVADHCAAIREPAILRRSPAFWDCSPAAPLES